jgi:rhamnosyltransferase
MNDGICAGMVLYNPEVELLKRNLQIIITQVKVIYIFDNASINREEISSLISSLDTEKIIYQYNSCNIGIAAALNYIIKLADKNGYKWILTMDQDSICSNNMINEYSEYLEYEKVAVICPFVLNNGKMKLDTYENMELPPFEYLTKSVQCITSASLTNIEIAKEVGLFNEDFFVDRADHEFYLRILFAGYLILRANKAYMIQQMGNAKRVKLFSWLYSVFGLNTFRRLSVVAEYSDYRLYLGNRNARYMRKRYKKCDFDYSAIFLLGLNTYYSIFYPRHHSRIKMWKNIIKGNLDWKKVKDIPELDYSMFSYKNVKYPN